MNESKRFAEFLVSLSYQSLKHPVIAKAKELILDQIGVQLASSTKPWSVSVYQYTKSLGGPAEASIVAYGTG